MNAGAVIQKNDMKQQPWILAYEAWNVDTGLATDGQKGADWQRHGRAMPDEMAQMMEARWPSGVRCKHRLGALANRRHAALDPLSPSPCLQQAGRTEISSKGEYA